MTQSKPTLQQSLTVDISQDTTSTDKQAKAPVDNTQPLSKTTTPQAVTNGPQTTPMSTRVASPPTRTPLGPIVTQFQPLSQPATNNQHRQQPTANI